jgi:hypothetical protein
MIYKCTENATCRRGRIQQGRADEEDEEDGVDGVTEVTEEEGDYDGWRP